MLVQRFAAYSEWRAHLSDVLEQFATWLSDNELSDAQTDRRIAHLLENLREDRLHVAFVAEFSRGKSELINAIFLPIMAIAFCRRRLAAPPCARPS